MANKKQKKPFSQTWWGKHQPFSFLFLSLPSIADAQRRWTLFQIILSLVFFVTAIAVGLLTIDISRVGGVIMVIAIFLFALGLLGLMYAIGIGIYWFYPRHTTNNDVETKRVERDDRLHKDIQESITNTHNDIQSLIKEIRQDRNGRKKDNR